MTLSPELLKNIKSFFVARIDVYGQWKNDKIKWLVMKEELTDNIIIKHLNHKETIGVYPYYKIDNEWYCKWMCLDIDDHKEKNVLKIKELLDNKTKKITESLQNSYKINKNDIVREFSGSGYHVWIKLKYATPLKKAYVFKENLEQHILKNFNMELEVNPKQKTMNKTDFGNFVKLPLGLNRKNNEFCPLLDDFDLSTQGDGYKIIEKGLIVKKKPVTIRLENVDLPNEGAKHYKQLPPCLKAIVDGKINAEGDIGNKMRITLTNFLYNIKAPFEVRINAYKNQPDFNYEKVKYHVEQCKKGVEKKGTPLISSCQKIKKRGYCNSDDCTGINYNKKKEKKTEDVKINYKLRDMILNEINIKTIYESGEFCLYQNGVYIKKKKRTIENIIEKLLEESDITFSPQRCNTILKLIELKTMVSIDEFDKNPYMINLKNGLYNLENHTFAEHSPKYLSLRRIPVNYNKDATCPKIDKFFHEIFYKNDIDLVYEIIGLCLTPITIFQKAFLFYGTGHNGKTTFLNMLTAFIGKSNRSSVALSEMTRQFEMAKMEGKIINILSDLDGSRMKIRPFKVYVGDELVITINRKFKEPYDIKPTAKLLYSVNDTWSEIPIDTDKGFFRKWIVINCPNEFDNVEDIKYIIPLLKKNELSGLLNKAIGGFNKLEKRGQFDPKYTNWRAIKDLWFLKSNDFMIFIKEVCEEGQYETARKNPNNQYWETKDDTLSMFNNFRMSEKNKPPISMYMLTKMIKKNPHFTITRRIVDGKSREVYTGFKFSEKKIAEMADESLESFL